MIYDAGIVFEVEFLSIFLYFTAVMIFESFSRNLFSVSQRDVTVYSNFFGKCMSKIFRSRSSCATLERVSISNEINSSRLLQIRSATSNAQTRDQFHFMQFLRREV